MKKILIYIACLAGFLAVSCKPDAYTGPLDSPVGNWEGTRSQYLFNGEQVADIDSCETTAISFYKQGLCCIEGVKGAFAYTYDQKTGYLQIDNSLWQVITLTGAEVVMQYLYTAYPPEETPEETPEVAPAAEETFNYNPYMDGLKVFEFTMNIVPPSINRVMEYAELEEKDIDYYVLHQANKMILQNIATGAKINIDKVLRETLSKIGNLSSASIPSVICDEHEKFNKKENNIVMSGFGVGLSWGCVALTLNKPLVLPIIYY